jgi:hypothetical protein
MISTKQLQELNECIIKVLSDYHRWNEATGETTALRAQYLVYLHESMDLLQTLGYELERKINK